MLGYGDIRHSVFSPISGVKGQECPPRSEYARAAFNSKFLFIFHFILLGKPPSSLSATQNLSRGLLQLAPSALAASGLWGPPF